MKIGDGGTVIAAAPVGEKVTPVKPWLPGVGLAVGAEDRGSVPPELLSSVVVGEALAENNGDGGTVLTAQVGE